MRAMFKRLIVGLGLKPIAYKLISILCLPTLFLYRQKLKHRLGKNKYELIKNVDVITFPLKLSHNVNLLSGGYAMEKILHLLGLEPKAFNPWYQFEKILYLEWQDLTYNLFKSDDFIAESLKYVHKENLKIIKVNNNANDISKKKVAKCFSSVFKYDLDIDPLTFTGEIVVKSNDNATHDGQVIIGPLKNKDIDPSYVYSIAINNIDSNGLATDYRLPYIGKCLNFCYVKKRPKINRFSNTNESAFMKSSSEVFSDSELKQIDEFCRLMGIDYGELDCLRDNNTGKLYIVDVAKTPGGPPPEISKKQRYEAILEMSVAFVENVISAKNFK
jgi:hypothetical protein